MQKYKAKLYMVAQSRTSTSHWEIFDCLHDMLHARHWSIRLLGGMDERRHCPITTITMPLLAPTQSNPSLSIIAITTPTPTHSNARVLVINSALVDIEDNDFFYSQEPMPTPCVLATIPGPGCSLIAILTSGCSPTLVLGPDSYYYSIYLIT